jgi:chemotaxis methyl-accepting protein methylase
MKAFDPRDQDTVLSSLIAWIETETGLCFPEVHHDTIHKTAIHRCSALEIELPLFLNLVQTDHDEKSRFFNDIMIGETYFFRDERHFSLLISSILPKLLLEGRKVNLWSATCATGEEALSLIAALKHVNETLRTGTPFTLLASDINSEALARLKKGAFPLSSFRNDGKKWHMLLDSCGSMSESLWQASGETLSHLQIRHLNILSGLLPENESQDIIFFRNTLVYMKAEQKEKAVSRIIETLRPGGFLFLASPEVPSIRHPKLEVLEREGSFIFRKLPAQSAAAPKDTAGNPPSPRAGSPPRDFSRQEANRTARPSTGQDRTGAAEKTDRDMKREIRRASPKDISERELGNALALASLWTLKPQLQKEAPSDSREAQTASMIAGIIAAIQANRFTVADELLRKFESLARENYASQYLRAMSQKYQGNGPQATELWEKARLFNPGFWPALFQAGLSYERTNPERSRLLLQECVNTMLQDTDENKYIVLLEGFDTSYYRRMAERLLARLKTS